jgi:benzoyl-CoA 2,3-dioxygenase component A
MADAAREDAAPGSLIRQHLIDPEICIRCNTCEATCPSGAITHDDRNYVVSAQLCNLCMACVPPCPTGAIDNWRSVPRAMPYAVEAQLRWDSLPAPLTSEALEAAGVHGGTDASAAPATPLPAAAQVPVPTVPSTYSSTVAPWSAATPSVNLYGPKNPVAATVVGNVRVTDAGTQSDTHHIVLDFGSTPFPLLEGQSIGIVPPGVDVNGRAHVARQYSIASPRNGERPGYNNASLTVKRVTVDHDGRPTHGVCSNYLCDLSVGQRVSVIGPFGASFLMPNHPQSNIVMICTGTGSAPMRAMTEWRRRLRKQGDCHGGKLVLFFGARTREELPYFGPLMSLPGDFIDVNLAFSRAADRPRRYVQDVMLERAAELGRMLHGDTYVYVCGLKAMEAGVLQALAAIAAQSGLDWSTLAPTLKRDGRLHLETY